MMPCSLLVSLTHSVCERVLVECVQGYEGQSHIGRQVKTEFIWIRPDL